MPSTNQLNTNSRSMNGLNNISVNSVFTDSLEVNNLIIDIQGTAQTKIIGDNTRSIATTEFVQNSILTVSGTYVDLTSAQNITGTKTFNNINITSIGSVLQTDNIDIVSNQTTGILNLGCKSDRSGNINIGTLTTGNAPIIIGSSVSSTQTSTHNAITDFTKIPSCSIAPSSSNNLCNKAYVDNAIGSSLLTSNNVFTGTNNFQDVIYINNPSAAKTLTIKSTNQNITITTGSSNNNLSGRAFNCNNINVPANNTENLITVTIPFDLCGFGGGLNYPAGTVTLTYSSISINILKNGSSYSGSSPTSTLYNYDLFSKIWTLPLATVKYPVFSALLGNVNVPIILDINNTSTDIYQINLTVNFTSIHSSGSTFGALVLTEGHANFTTTDYNNTSAVFENFSPPYISYAKISGDNGIYLSANNTLNFQSSATMEFLSSTNFNNVLPQSNLRPLNNSDLANKLYIDNALSKAITSIQNSLNPIGSIIMMTTFNVPDGYLYCDGTTYNTLIYAGLWSVIFYTYGGTGSNFKVPNYQSCFLRGFGSMTTGSVTYSAPSLGTIQQDAVLNPLYASNQGWRELASAGSGKQCISRFRQTGDTIDTTTGILPRFDRTATENRPINQSVYYYIKF